MRSLITIKKEFFRTGTGGLLLIAGLSAEVGLAQKKADLSQDSESFAASAGQLGCDYRDGFHVPLALRKEGDSFEWGVFGVSTPVRLRVREKISTSHAEAGDRIDLEVVDDVLVNGYPVIRKGAQAWGIIRNSQRPGMGVEWSVYDPTPHPPEPLFGHNGEFPRVQLHGGRLRFQIEGVYDITGGAVSLKAIGVISGSDNSPSDPSGLVIVLAWQALGFPLQKLSGAHVHSLAGTHAVLRKGTEIEARVDAAVCYDVAFLARIRAMELIQAHEDQEPEGAIRHASSAGPHVEPRQTGGTNLGLMLGGPTSQANLAAAMHDSLAHGASRERPAVRATAPPAPWRQAIQDDVMVRVRETAR